MRTKKDFEMIADDFYYSTHRKTGIEFMVAVYDFMERHNFEHKFSNIIYENGTACVTLITDNIFNTVGFVYIEFYDDDSKRGFMVADKNEFIRDFLT